MFDGCWRVGLSQSTRVEFDGFGPSAEDGKPHTCQGEAYNRVAAEWSEDPDPGVVTKRTYDDATGRLARRIWARGGDHDLQPR